MKGRKAQTLTSRGSAWGQLLFAACVTASLHRQAEPMGSPVARDCQAPVRAEGVLTCANDPSLPPASARDVACVSLVRGGQRVRCDREGVERGYMPADELAALDVQISLNDAPAKALESIRGVGPVLAGRLCAHRPFATVNDVRSVRGVGVRKYEAIAARACEACPAPRQLRFTAAGDP